MDDSCDGDVATTTETGGQFTLEVPQSALISGAQILVIPDSMQVMATPGAPAIQYRALIENDNIASSVNVSPFTTQVSDKVSLGNSKNLSLAILQAQNEVLQQNNFPVDKQSIVFGDFLSYPGDDSYNAITARATQSKLWQERAKEREEELRNDPKYANKWDSINVVAWNVWMHDFNTREFFERYEEYVHLKKTENSKQVERFEGTQWFIDENGNPTDSILQNYEEDKTWGEEQLNVKTYWEFDYNQDRVFDLKGEKAGRGTYSHNNQGLLVMKMRELYNESDKAPEGGLSYPGRKFCPGFDIVGEMDKLTNDEPFNPCVDFVQLRAYEDKLNDNDTTFTQSDMMTHWEKPFDEDPLTSSVDMSIAAYYEERLTHWYADGSRGSEIYYDWEAKSINLDIVDPFTVIQKDRITVDGGQVNEISTPDFDNSPILENTVPGTGIRQFNQVNLVSWKNFSKIYQSEEYEQNPSQNTDHSIATRILNTSKVTLESGKEIELNLPVEGAAPIYEATQKWDSEQQILTNQWTFQPIPSGVDKSIGSEHGPANKIQGQQSLSWQSLVGGITTALQEVKFTVEGGSSNTENRPAFTPDYFDGNVFWTVTSKDLPEELMALLFGGGSDFKFSDRIPANELTVPAEICWDKELFSVDFNLLHKRGGDIVVSSRCDDGWWLKEQYMLRMKDQLKNNRFTAELLDWAKGANSYTTKPTKTYTLEFTTK